MSNKEKSNQSQPTKLSKRAQKAAKQEEKIKQGILKPDKKEFTELVGIQTAKKDEYSTKNFIIIKNKKVEEYAQEIHSLWQKEKVKIVGFGKQIPKTISCAQAFKRKAGVYDERNVKVTQQNKIKKEQNGEAIMQISFEMK